MVILKIIILVRFNVFRKLYLNTIKWSKILSFQKSFWSSFIKLIMRSKFTNTFKLFDIMMLFYSWYVETTFSLTTLEWVTINCCLFTLSVFTCRLRKCFASKPSETKSKSRIQIFQDWRRYWNSKLLSKLSVTMRQGRDLYQANVQWMWVL